MRSQGASVLLRPVLSSASMARVRSSAACLWPANGQTACSPELCSLQPNV